MNDFQDVDDLSEQIKLMKEAALKIDAFFKSNVGKLFQLHHANW